MSTLQLAGGIEFDRASGEVRRGGTVVRLEPQPAGVLAALAARPGELVTHDELRREVWGDATHVKLHDALHYCIRQVRQALGDTARQPRYIETIPRRGYRMRAESVALWPAPAAPALRGSRVLPAAWRWPVRFALAAALAAAIVAVEQRPNTHHQVAVALLKSLHDLVF